MGMLSFLVSGGEWRGEAKAPLFGAVMFLAPKRESRGLFIFLRRLALRRFLEQTKRMAIVIMISTAPPIASPIMTPIVMPLWEVEVDFGKVI